MTDGHGPPTAPGSTRRPRRALPLRAGTAVLLAVACGASVVAASAGAASGPDAGSVTTTSAGTATTLLPAPPAVVPPLWDREDVDGAVAQIDAFAQAAMDSTGVPGLAVAVVYQDEVIFAEGYGVREVGEPEAVDADTVFQIASVSKPIASTIVAGAIGEGIVGSWQDPVVGYNPDFALKDPYVSEHATFADLFSHRSGLSTGAGDLLEDLGWGRDHILGVLDQQPLDAFRSSYHYSNFGVTAGGEAAAVAAGMSWEDLADRTLFEPLGMDSTSYRHADFLADPDRARIHVEVGEPGSGVWEAKYERNPDAEAPAGGASSSVADMAEFLRLQLAGGTFDGEPVIDPGALQTTHLPHQALNHPTDPAARTNFYGLGWNVSTDDQGRVRLGHSGAFGLGAATNVAMIPGEQVGIVTLTNGAPIGVPEAINNAFFDAAQNGHPTVDWLPYMLAAFESIFGGPLPGEKYETPAVDPQPAQASEAYVGTYDNSYYGPLQVTAEGGALAMAMGPDDQPTTFALQHWDGDTFSFQTIGENATGLSGAIFTVGEDDVASSVRLEFYDTTGLGTFTRAS